MAFLPNEPGEPKWQVIDIDDLVCLIENPGLDTERIHFKWELTASMSVSTAIQQASSYEDFLSTEQRAMLLFWLGYFYAYFTGRR